MHALVRNLYKEALYVGRDYPLGLDKVRREWKKGIRNPENCPSCYNITRLAADDDDGDRKEYNSTASGPAATVVIPKKMHSREYPNPDCERELRKAVGKGRYMIREMIGVIQFKKYRSLKRRYNDNNDDSNSTFHALLAKLQNEEVETSQKRIPEVPQYDER